LLPAASCSKNWGTQSSWPALVLTLSNKPEACFRSCSVCSSVSYQTTFRAIRISSAGYGSVIMIGGYSRISLTLHSMNRLAGCAEQIFAVVSRVVIRCRRLSATAGCCTISLLSQFEVVMAKIMVAITNAGVAVFHLAAAPLARELATGFQFNNGACHNGSDIDIACLVRPC
jgi:hypothetical protein